MSQALQVGDTVKRRETIHGRICSRVGTVLEIGGEESYHTGKIWVFWEGRYWEDGKFTPEGRRTWYAASALTKCEAKAASR